MSNHVYIRLAGHGLIVIPRAPYSIIRSNECGEAGLEELSTSAIDVEYFSPDGTLFTRLLPDSNGAYRSKVDQYTNSPLDVVDVEAGLVAGDWQVQTSVYSCGWPAGYSIVSNSFPNDSSAFDFRGREDELIFFQTAHQIPDVEQFCAPGQRIVHVERSAEFDSIMLAYEIDSEPHRQCHLVVKLAERHVVCTAQCRAHRADACFEACRSTALSFRWTPESPW